MKVYLEGKEPPPDEKRFSGSIGTKTAELDDNRIDRLDMREALTRFGQELAAQFSRHKLTDGGGSVIGVKLVGIDFQFLFSLPEKEESEWR